MDARSLPTQIELPDLHGEASLRVATDVASQAGAITTQGLSLLERWKRRLRILCRRTSKRITRMVRAVERRLVVAFRKRVVKRVRARRRYRRPALPE
jgi:hypothetical protein